MTQSLGCFMRYLSRYLRTVAKAKLLAALTPEERQVLAALKPQQPVQQQPIGNPTPTPADKLREAVMQLTKEQASSLPAPLASAILDVLGHRGDGAGSR